MNFQVLKRFRKENSFDDLPKPDGQEQSFVKGFGTKQLLSLFFTSENPAKEAGVEELNE